MEKYKDWCERCINLKMTSEQGMICKLIDQKPNFDESCQDFDFDPNKRLNKPHLALHKRKNNHRKIFLGFLSFSFGVFNLAIWVKSLLASENVIISLLIGLIFFLVGSYMLFDGFSQKKKLNVPTNLPVSPQKAQNPFYSKNLISEHHNSFNLWLWKKRLKRITKRKIKRWVSQESYGNLQNTYVFGNVQQRMILLEELQSTETTYARYILFQALNDSVYPVVMQAVNAFKIQKNTNADVIVSIEKIIEKWDADQKRVKENWENYEYAEHQEQYLDKSNMVRLKSVKQVMKNMKGGLL